MVVVVVVRFFVLCCLFLLAVGVSGDCGGDLSLLNFHDVDTGDWLNVSIYTTVDLNYVGVRNLDASILDPHGGVIYVNRIQLNNSVYVVNYSLFINEFWVDGTHRLNATVVTVNSSNPSQELCRRSNIVSFEVSSNRTAYEGNVIKVDFKPLNVSSTKRLSKMVCFGGFCQNMSLTIPLDVDWSIDFSNQSFSLPSSWNTTDYNALITVENVCYNYSTFLGLFEWSRGLVNQHGHERDAFDVQRMLLEEQNVGLLGRYTNCSEENLNLSKKYIQIEVDYKNVQSTANSIRGDLSQCRLDKASMYSQSDLTWTGVVVCLLTLGGLRLLSSHKARTPDK